MATVVFAGSVGTIIEWYDFLIYGTAAAFVFNTCFFPTSIPWPVPSFAGNLFGRVRRPSDRRCYLRSFRRSDRPQDHADDHNGDHGVGNIRRRVPADLPADRSLGADSSRHLAVHQGIGLGGEWGGASLMVIEHAPPGRRGLFGSLVQIGFPLGLVTSSGVFALVTMMPEADFKSWGWRIPFLSASCFLVSVGSCARACRRHRYSRRSSAAE